MSERSLSFVRNWISENLRNDPLHDASHPNIRPRDLAVSLIAEAAKVGISTDEIEEETGDVEDFLVAAWTSATDQKFKD